MSEGVITGNAKLTEKSKSAPNDQLVTEFNLNIFTSRLLQDSGYQWLALIQF